jgi:hypothetical protein
MAIRHLILAALVTSAFSAHASTGDIYASTGTGTVLLATSATGQVQTYMPRAVEGFFMFQAAPTLLASAGQSTAPAETTAAQVQVAAPAEVSMADLVKVGASSDIAADVPAVDASAGATGDAIVNASAPTNLLALAVAATAVPEPGTGGLMLAGLAGVGLMARRRRSR